MTNQPIKMHIRDVGSCSDIDDVEKDLLREIAHNILKGKSAESIKALFMADFSRDIFNGLPNGILTVKMVFSSGLVVYCGDRLHMFDVKDY